MRAYVVLAVLGVCLLVLAGGLWALDSRLGREYLFWITSAFRDVSHPDPSIGPPLPRVEAGGAQVPVASGTISWMMRYGDRWQGIEGDMFMSYPQLARFRKLETPIIQAGTAVTIRFPRPTRTMELSLWRFGKEVERKVIPNGYSFIPGRRGVHIFGLWASFPEDPNAIGSGSGHYAFMIRVR